MQFLFYRSHDIRERLAQMTDEIRQLDVDIEENQGQYNPDMVINPFIKGPPPLSPYGFFALYTGHCRWKGWCDYYSTNIYVLPCVRLNIQVHVIINE